MIAKTAFKFDNQAAHIGSFTREMLDYLQPQLAQHGQGRAVLLRAKFIIAEFLNNAVKHSDTNESEITIEIDDASLVIDKTDFGRPFNLVGELEKQDSQLMVSSDAMHLLYAIKKSEHTVSFYCKENLTLKLDVNQLAEHLGLLIITKAADEFTYTYKNPINVFSAKLNLNC